MYLSSGAMMDGLVFSPWQVDGKRGGGTGEDCGEDLLSNCGWEGGGVSSQLFNMKGDHFSTCFLFPIMHYWARIFFCSDSTVDEKEEH